LIGLLFILFACTEEVVVKPFDYPKIFTGEDHRSWVIRSFQIVREGRGTISGDPVSFFGACVADDIYTFHYNSERSYVITDGAKKCSASDPDVIVDSSWSFVNSTSTLTIIMPILSDQPLPFTLKEVDDTKLVIDIYYDETSAYRFNFKTTSVE
jgi:hypothetical protein